MCLWSKIWELTVVEIIALEFVSNCQQLTFSVWPFFIFLKLSAEFDQLMNFFNLCEFILFAWHLSVCLSVHNIGELWSCSAVNSGNGHTTAGVVEGSEKRGGTEGERLIEAPSGGARIEVPSGVESGEERPLPRWLRDLGEHHELPQRDPGLGWKRILDIFSAHRTHMPVRKNVLPIGLFQGKLGNAAGHRALKLTTFHWYNH